MPRSAGRLGMGIVVGGLLAMGATVVQRELLRRAGSRLIDWEAVRLIARRRLGPAGVSLSAAERASAEAFYRETLLRIEPEVAAAIGADLPRALETPAVVDRLEWIDLNLATFEQLFARVEQIVTAGSADADTPGRALARIVNRSLGNQQLGWLMAFMARKVLGQYDVSLLAAGPATRGRLNFVEQNIVATAAGLRIPLDDFRTFIALHEATHAFEFEAYPWLRDHFAASVAEAIEQLAVDSGGLAGRLRAAMAGKGGHWLERMMTPAQLAAFHRTQALMSLLEGYSNHVMNHAGERILPGFARLHERFERRNEARTAGERAVMRLTLVAPRPGRDQAPGALDRPDRGIRRPWSRRVSVDEIVILATPIFGAPVSAEHVARMEAVTGVRVVQMSADGLVHDHAEEALAAARVLLRGGVPASVLDHVIGRAPRLEWIHSFSAGVDRVATPVVRTRGLTVTNARGVFSRPIAEYVVMMSLAISRSLPQLLELQQERTWQPLRGTELGRKTSGVVGFGSIGSEIPRLLAPFGTRILATRRRPEPGADDLPNVELLGLDRLREVLPPNHNNNNS